MPKSLGSPRFLYHLKGSRFLYLNGVGKTLESFTTCKELTGIIPCAAAAAAQFPATTPKPYLSVLKLFCTPETDSELMKNVRSKLQPRHIHTLDWNECGRVMLHLAPFQ
ncbi:unnamed protein product [Cuscuta campestris]|uniref:Uncharacterized protein n=1 Tax=Cuscuta campestris TaxID=132261 RepID=A0A484NIL9_9ASTE|nr:unnamed protein product [Cuscuta campestris]